MVSNILAVNYRYTIPRFGAELAVPLDCRISSPPLSTHSNGVLHSLVSVLLLLAHALAGAAYFELVVPHRGMDGGNMGTWEQVGPVCPLDASNTGPRVPRVSTPVCARDTAEAWWWQVRTSLQGYKGTVQRVSYTSNSSSSTVAVITSAQRPLLSPPMLSYKHVHWLLRRKSKNPKTIVVSASCCRK